MESTKETPKVRRNIGDIAESLFAWPWFGGITTILGVMAGYFGVHFDREIAEFFFEQRWDGSVLDFLLPTIGFGICFTGTVWAQSRGAARARDELKVQTDMVAELVRNLSERTDLVSSLVRQLQSLPPAGYLHKFESSLTASTRAAAAVLDIPNANAPEIANSIRTILRSVEMLASSLETTSGARYGVNIMIFIPRENIDGRKQDVYLQRMPFWNAALDFGKLAGVLDLETTLSIATDDNKAAMGDPKLVSIALQVPCTETRDGTKLEGTDVLPGAPWTQITGEPTGFYSPEHLLEITGSGDFFPSMLDAMNKYFEGPGAVVKSFACFPLPQLGEDIGEFGPGVLNIHRDSDGLFNEGRMELMAPLLTPFTALLSRLVSKYVVALASES